MPNAKILVVEDESIEAVDIKQTLESFGYEVPFIASTGEEAIDKARAILPDLVLMDIVLMGNVDGIEAASKIRDDLFIPVIFLTAHSEESTVKKALMSEPYGYLFKPFDRNELKYTIELAIYKHDMEKRLKESEEKYRLLTEKMNDIIWTLDMDLKTTYVSSSIEKVLGFTPGERIKQSIKEQLSLKSLSKVYQILKNELKLEQEDQSDPERTLKIELEYKHKDGSTLWMENIISGIRDEKGRLVGLHGVSRDINERKKAEEYLKESELNFRALAENANEGILIASGGGNHLYVNQKAAEITGYTIKELLKISIVDLAHPDELKKIKDNLKKRIMGEDVSSTYETLIVRKDNSIIPIELTGSKTIWKGQNADIVIFRDISDRKKADKSIQESEKKYRDLTELLPQIVFEIDIMGKITFANLLAFKSFLYTQKDFDKGLNIHQMLVPEDQDRTKENIQRILNGEDLGGSEYTAKRKDGTTFPILIYASAIIHENVPVGLRGIIIDITDLKKAKKLLKESEHRYKMLGHLISDFAYSCVPGESGNYEVDWITDSFYHMTGFSEKDLKLNRCWMFTVHPDDENIAQQQLEELKAGGKNIRTFRIVSSAGEVRYIKNYIECVEDKNLGKLRLYGATQDITERKIAEEKLITSEEFYRTIFENTGTAILTFENDGTIIMINSEWERLSGYSREEVEGKMKWMELAHPDYLKMMIEYHRQRLIDPKSVPKEYETAFINKSGDILVMYISVTAIPGTDKWLASAIDITDLKKAQENLRESEVKYRSLVENAADALFVHDFNGRFVDVNRQACESLGYSRDELLQMGVFDVEEDFDLESARREWSKIEPGEPFTLYGHQKRKNGTIFPVEIRFAIVTLKGEKLFMVLVRDITQIKKAEFDLRESLKEKEITSKVVMQLAGVSSAREIYSIIGRAVKELLPDSYVIVSGISPDKKNLYLREILGAEKFLDKLTAILRIDPFKMKFPVAKIPEKEIKKRQSGRLKEYKDGIYSLTFGIIPRPVCRIIEKLAHVGEVHSIRFIFEDKHYGGVSIALLEGQPMEYKKTIETIVYQASIALQRVRAEKAIKDSLKEKEVLLQEIHHRVKNNMQIISSLMNLQTKYVDEEETLNVLKESQGRVKTMAMIHEKLYTSSDLSHINLKDYIEKLVYQIFYTYGKLKDTIQPILNIKNIEMGMETAIPLGLIINELVSNSLKYAYPEGRKGKVKISLQTVGNEYKLIISDDGIGFPEGIDFKKTESLGLQLVNNLVSQIDGKIELDRSQGTEFKITFKEIGYKERI